MTRAPDDDRHEPQFGYDDYRKDPYFEDAAPKAKKRTTRPKRRQRSLILVFLVGAVIILFCGFLAMSYLKGPKLVSGQLPVITADLSPIKIKPDKTDESAVPFQNTTVYDDLDKNRQKHAATEVEHLLQAPEQPLPLPVPAPADVKLAEPVKPETPPPLPAQLPQPASAPQTEDEAALAPAQPTAPAVPTALQAPEALPPPPLPPSKPAPVTVKPATSNETGTGTVILQLGSFHDEAAARSEWLRLKARHGDQLSALSSSVQYVNLGEKGIWYRLRAGPLPADKAKAACAELLVAKTPCIVSGQK